MSSGSDNASHCTGRRQFLKSLFGLGGVLESGRAASAAAVSGAFYWADLKTGQVGFPTGKAALPGLPGSMMKLVAAAAIRQENLLASNTTIDCKGQVRIHRKLYVCQKPHGKLNITEAIAHSCNVFFATAADVVSPSLFLQYARRFGLGDPVAGIASAPFPASAASDPHNYVLGLAADLTPNGLQLMRVAALVAMHGSIPHLYSAESPEPEGKPFVLKLAEPTWAVLGQGMQIACRKGTARALDPENRLRVAAKTGTAPHGKTFQSWLVGYFPWDKPRYAFCARAFSGTSQDKAVPLARQFLFATDWPV